MAPALLRTACVVLLTVGVAASADAQIASGLNELNVAASISATKASGDGVPDGDAETSTQFNAAYGRFLTDRFELGAQFNVLKVEGEDAFGTYGAVAAFHFGPTSGVVVPFVGAQLGRGYGQHFDLGVGDVHNPWAYGAFGGVKAFVGGGGGAVTVQPFWTRQTRSFESGGRSGHVHADQYGVLVGVSVFIR